MTERTEPKGERQEHPESEKYPGKGQKGGTSPNPEAQQPSNEPSSGSGSNESETQPCDHGQCACELWPTDCLPQNGSIRRLLEALEKKLQKYQDKPTEASKQFEKDLQGCDKEYQSVTDIIKKYEAYFCQLECDVNEAKSQREDIKSWCSKVSESMRTQIREIWTVCYEQEEKRLECGWIGARDCVESLKNCLEQAKNKESEATDDLEATKNFEKTVKERFADLKALHAKAKTHYDNKEYKSVCVVELQFEKIYDSLGELPLWSARRERCDGEGSQDGEAPDLKERTPEWLRERLTYGLRVLILAKYQRFRWHDYMLEKEKERTRSKELLEVFRAMRRTKCAQEAEELEEPPTSGQQSAA